MSFQKVVNINPALGVAGEFASNNPFFSLVAGEGQWVAGANGVLVGQFAFANPADNTVSNTYTDGHRMGFVIRNYNALITEYDAEASMTIPKGREVTLISSGDVFSICADATVDFKVLASKTDGSLKAVAQDADLSTETDHLDTGFVIGEVAENNLVKITKLG